MFQLDAVKLEDIANKLNISVSTVSRALNGKGRVSERTRTRVREAVQESNYTVNAIARSLRLRNGQNIGIVVPDISNGFFASVIKGAQQICRDNGYTLMVCNSDESSEYEEEALQRLLEKQVSGLILASVNDKLDIIQQYMRMGIPVVLIDNVPEDAGMCDVVSIDNFAAARDLTQAVIARGYRKIGIITGPCEQPTGVLRYKGFVQALDDAGIALNPDWVMEGDFRIESGYEKMQQLLKLANRPHAIICANNYMTYGAINAIRDARMRIPEDVAVAAFDAMDHTGLITPKITSINQPARDIGKSAAEIIMKHLLQGINEEPINIILKPSFSKGSSW